MKVFKTRVGAERYIFKNYDWLNTDELERFYDEYIFEYQGKYMVPSKYN